MTPEKNAFGIDLSDEVVRGAIVTQNGDILPPAPRAAPPPPPVKTEPAAATPEPVALTPWQKKTREVAGVTAGMGSVLALGKWTSPLLMSNAFTFALAGLVGYRAVWGVAPALHSPLMSVTNAISGMVGIGGLFILGGGFLPATIPQAFGALSVLLAFVNVGGGFVITKRMLDMFKRESPNPKSERN
jgi:NAD(P) transhydrogenase